MELEKVFSEFPGLRFQGDDEGGKLVGIFPVRLPTGDEIDRYIVSIVLPLNLENGIPVVWEVGGKIPRTKTRHCRDDGSLCVFLREERYLYYPIGSELLCFLKGPLNSYLFGQLYFDEFKKWPSNFKEWNHGALGKRDFYREFLNLPEADYGTLLNIVREVKGRTYRRHQSCPCGSSKKTKQCHWLKLFELEQKVEARTLELASQDFEKFKTDIAIPGLTRDVELPEVVRANQLPSADASLLA